MDSTLDALHESRFRESSSRLISIFMRIALSSFGASFFLITQTLRFQNTIPWYLLAET